MRHGAFRKIVHSRVDIHSLCGRDKQYTFVSDNMRLRITACENPELSQPRIDVHKDVMVIQTCDKRMTIQRKNAF